MYSFIEKRFHVEDSDTSSGSFDTVLSKYKSIEPALNQDNDCPAYRFIHDKNPKSAASWWIVCSLRYIDQMSKNINKR
jgi:hypothetical protein